MDQRNIKLEVQALWLQYSGLRTGPAGRTVLIENAARIPVTRRPAEEFQNIPGLIVAT